jgi:heat shock protein HtpX
MNRTKTFLLLAALTALFLWMGQALGGRAGFVIALVAAAAMNFGAWWFSDRMVLAMYRAQELTEADSPRLHRLVGELARRAGVPAPRLYLIPEDAPNAFATGRDPRHGVVAVTQGLLERLDHDEVAGVIAHEIGHIRHRDTLVMSVAATLAGALSMLANMAMWSSLLGGGSDDEEDHAGGLVGGLLGVLVAPIAASLIQMAISRSREFLADEAAARYTGAPLALASALRKIEAWASYAPMQTATPATSHLLILNPFTGGGLLRLFRTHPPTEERIARLESMSRNPAQAA